MTRAPFCYRDFVNAADAQRGALGITMFIESHSVSIAGMKVKQVGKVYPLEGYSYNRQGYGADFVIETQAGISDSFGNSLRMKVFFKIV